MNEPRLPDSFRRLRPPAPPPELRTRLAQAALAPISIPRRAVPLGRLLWAASMAGLVAVNLWLDAHRHARVPPSNGEPPSLHSLAELRRGLPDDLPYLF